MRRRLKRLSEQVIGTGASVIGLATARMAADTAFEALLDWTGVSGNAD